MEPKVIVGIRAQLTAQSNIAMAHNLLSKSPSAVDRAPFQQFSFVPKSTSNPPKTHRGTVVTELRPGRLFCDRLATAL